MKNEKGLILVGLLLAIVVLIANVGIPAMAGGYDIDCTKVVKYSRFCATCDNPTVITQGWDDGKITMTVTTSVPDEFYRSELGTIDCSLEEHRAQEQAVQDEIMANTDITVDFYVYGKGYYPCTINRRTGKISITLTGDNVPPVGSWVGLRFSNVECDTYDKTVYVPLPGTLLNEFKEPGYDNEVPLTVLGYSRQ